jgi:hypothetical protein
MMNASSRVSHGVYSCVGRVRIAGPGGGGAYPPEGEGGGG